MTAFSLTRSNSVRRLPITLLVCGAAATAIVANDTPANDAPGGGVVRQRVGVAYAAEGNEILYREFHRARWQGGRPVSETVIYRDADGKRMAEKTIDYRQSLQAPAFHLVMQSPTYEEGLTVTDKGLQVFVRPPGESTTKRQLLTVARSDLVADAGFDRLIKEQFAAITAGETLEFNFLVPSRLKSYAFRARKVDETEILGEPALQLSLEPAGFFMRWLAEPIEVWYQRDSGRLLRYLGPSNLRRADGSNPRVRVDFAEDTVSSPADGDRLQKMPRTGGTA